MATTEKQVAANRRNAASSTGPRTEEGKSVSRLNALSHGLTAEAPCLPTEDPEEYARFRKALLDHLAPVGALEEQLAEEVVDLSWRLRRATTLEHGVLARGVASVDERHYLAVKRTCEITERDVADAELAARVGRRDQVIEIINPHVHEDLEELLGDLVPVKRSEEVRLAEAFVDDASGSNAITKLGRHETSLFRRRNQTLEVLRVAQDARRTASKKETK
jgi:hypothetical protein